MADGAFCPFYRKSIRDSSASVGQLVKNIEQISGSMESMASSFNILDKEAQSGMSKQQKVNERISQIDEQSQMLQEANMAIAAIAEQTNFACDECSDRSGPCR